LEDHPLETVRSLELASLPVEKIFALSFATIFLGMILLMLGIALSGDTSSGGFWFFIFPIPVVWGFGEHPELTIVFILMTVFFGMMLLLRLLGGRKPHPKF
jgi:hypothetical protein